MQFLAVNCAPSTIPEPVIRSAFTLLKTKKWSLPQYILSERTPSFHRSNSQKWCTGLNGSITCAERPQLRAYHTLRHATLSRAKPSGRRLHVGQGGPFVLAEQSGICSQQRALRGSQGRSLKVAGHRRQQETGSYDMQTTELAQLAFLI